MYVSRLLVLFLVPLVVQGACAQQNTPETRQFVVEGLVSKRTIWDINTIGKFPQAQLGDIAIRKHTGDNRDTIKHVKGVLLKTLIDSAHVALNSPKEFGEIYIELVASDGYKNLYSWNELFNSELGNHVFVITEQGGENMERMKNSILVMSLQDFNNGSRHLRGLSRVIVKRVE